MIWMNCGAGAWFSPATTEEHNEKDDRDEEKKTKDREDHRDDEFRHSEGSYAVVVDISL